LRVWYEKGGFFGGNKFVSAYVERDKKKFEKMDFCSYPPAHFTPLKRRGGYGRISSLRTQKQG